MICIDIELEEKLKIHKNVTDKTKKPVAGFIIVGFSLH